MDKKLSKKMKKSVDKGEKGWYISKALEGKPESEAKREETSKKL